MLQSVVKLTCDAPSPFCTHAANAGFWTHEVSVAFALHGACMYLLRKGILCQPDSGCRTAHQI